MILTTEQSIRVSNLNLQCSQHRGGHCSEIPLSFGRLKSRSDSDDYGCHQSNASGQIIHGGELPLLDEIADQLQQDVGCDRVNALRHARLLLESAFESVHP